MENALENSKNVLEKRKLLTLTGGGRKKDCVPQGISDNIREKHHGGKVPSPEFAVQSR